jgi:hypothetical protein
MFGVKLMNKTNKVNPEFHAKTRALVENLIRRVELTKKLDNETLTTDEFLELMALLAKK